MESLEEIREFREYRRSSYVQVLDYVKKLLDKFHLETLEGRQSIYRITTRKDYQLDELKTVESIQKKLQTRRNELSEKGCQNPEKQYTLFSIEDMVGVKVICIYPLDIDIVINYIEKLKNGGNFHQCEGEWVEPKIDVRTEKGQIKKTESGYKAYHYKVSPPGELGYFLCEIQILTILGEAAAVKSHSLIYKPNGLIEEEYVESTKLLNDSLRCIDEQSKVLEKTIRKKRKMERRRKDAARTLLMQKIAEAIPDELSELVDSVRQPELSIEKAKEIAGQISLSFKSCGETDFNLCRIAAFLATRIPGDELNEWVLDIIDRYISRVDEMKKGDGHSFKSLTLWALGKEDAITKGEATLELAQRQQNNDLIREMKANIAYFAADFQVEQYRNKALEYSKEAFEEKTDPSYMDTFGYVQIVFGESDQDILTGWTTCKKAYQESEKSDLKDLAGFYLLIAQQKALDRLSEFSEKDILIS